MPRFIRTAAETLRKLAIRLGEALDSAGRPAPKLIPVPVPAKTPAKDRPRR